MSSSTNKVSTLGPGSILSETSFYIVESINGIDVTMRDGNGNSVNIGNAYVNAILNSADYYEKEQACNMTELADLFLGKSRVAISVAYFKKAKPKGKRAYKAEVQAKIDEIKAASIGDVQALLLDVITNPISDTIPGDLRVMKGRHYGEMNDLGRILFTDMEDPKRALKQVDPRTIQYFIVEGVKYYLK